MSSSASKRPIIVLTAREDVHLPYVQQHLTKPMAVIDPLVDFEKSQLSYSFKKAGIRLFYDGEEISDPRSIWFRKPRATEYEKIPVATQNMNYSKSAIDMHRSALYSMFPNAFWVSDYYAMQRAGRKPIQLDVAARLGFRVPETLFTSDARAAEEFVKRLKTCVVKPLAYRSMLAEDGTPVPFFTRKIHYKDNIDFSGLYLAPSIFQQAINVKTELRVTVVGNKTFTGAITTSGLSQNSPYLDYKLAYTKAGAKVIVSPYELPKDIAQKCIAHARAFNLPYCAIDLLLDMNDEYWFLENNPNGQWAFVESDTGLPIGKAIAELLEKARL